MKKLILLLVVLLTVVSENLQAQTFEQNKHKYSDSTYTYQKNDKYDPLLCGGLSLFVPGLGQMVCGETERGLAFMAGQIGFALVFAGGSVGFIYNAQIGNDKAFQSSFGVLVLGFAGFAAIKVWSVIDAEHVAKINNLYYRDKNKTSLLKLEIAPYVSQLNINNQLTTPVGMTLRVKF